MGILVLAVLIGLIPAMIAHSKGRSFASWWIYGAALFIIALPHALLINAEGMKKCPYCAEMIRAEARVCRYCSRELVKIISETEDYNFKGMSKEEAINIWKANPSDKRPWGEIVTLWEKANK
jgi:hypothetical protein